MLIVRNLENTGKLKKSQSLFYYLDVNNINVLYTDFQSLFNAICNHYVTSTVLSSLCELSH